jgi:hypothetical protein
MLLASKSLFLLLQRVKKMTNLEDLFLFPTQSWTMKYECADG